MKKFSYEITDYTLELPSSDEVFVEIDKDTTAQMFKDQGCVPYNGYDEAPDETYVAGDLQYIFAKGTDDIVELLLFPVYEDKECKDSFENGDFIIPPDYVFDNEEVTNAVIAYLHQVRKPDQ